MPVRIVASGSWRARNSPKEAWLPCITAYSELTSLNDNGEILGYIPQVEQTYTYFQSAYSHINEYQLCIGESTTSQRPELQVNKGEGKQIMTVEQAMIFALQRCKTAEEALTLITSLMEKYGFLLLRAGIRMSHDRGPGRSMGSRTFQCR